jgi:hypothetical protein
MKYRKEETQREKYVNKRKKENIKNSNKEI